MTDAMRHRGPDSAGFLDCGRVAVGMRRLRIIDLATGDQPIYSESGQVAVVLNGEIYNFAELLEQLRLRGHVFRTCSDTEVIVHAYEEWGKECVACFRGMFAFAVVDSRTPAQHVFIARDRLGIKPLYYSQNSDRLVFASEVRALLRSNLLQPRLSLAGLYSYLNFGTVQEPLTMIEGIRSLPPASWLLCTLTESGATFEAGTYWKPPARSQHGLESDDLRTLLSSTVQQHLISDVPLGAFLSGGLDSGAIVGLASQANPRPLHTFTLGFNDWPADEREGAAATANRHRTDHHLHVISEAQFAADLPGAVAAMDQPSVDAINTWFVARAARESGLTVALSGVGGDELFAGYPSFRRVPRLRMLQRAPALMGGAIRATAPWLGIKADGARKLAELVEKRTIFQHPYFAVRALFSQHQATSLLSHAAWAGLRESPMLQAWRTTVQRDLDTAGQYDSVGAVSWLELSQYMRSTLLRDTDQMSMAHSLEVRVPFVDHILLERVLPMPGQAKLRNGRSKALLVDALSDLFPPALLTQEKRTFTLPFERWLATSLRETVRSTLVTARQWSQYGLNETSVREVWAMYEHGETNWARPWSLYVLLQWLTNHVAALGN